MSDWLTVILSIVHVALVIAFAARRVIARQFDGFAPVWAMLLAQVITFGVRPILLCIDEVRYGAYWPIVRFDADAYQFASGCGLAATLALMVGYELVWRYSSGRIPIADSTPRSFTLLIFSVGIACAALALTLRLDRAVAGLSTGDLVAGRARREIGRQTVGYGYETLAWNLVPTYVTALAARYLSDRPRRPYLVLIATLMGLAIISPVGGRQLFGIAIAGVGYVYHYRVKRLPNWAAGVLAAVLLIMASVVGNMRDASGMSATEALAYTSKSFDGFEALVAMYHRFDVEDVVWGSSYFEALYSFIPRFIWTNKPAVWGALAAEGYVYPNLLSAYGNVGTFPVGFVAEALYNFWYFGLIVVPILGGMGLAQLERLGGTASRSSIFAVAAGLVVGNLIGWIRSFSEEGVALLLQLGIAALMLGPRRIGVVASVPTPAPTPTPTPEVTRRTAAAS